MFTSVSLFCFCCICTWGHVHENVDNVVYIDFTLYYSSTGGSVNSPIKAAKMANMEIIDAQFKVYFWENDFANTLEVRKFIHHLLDLNDTQSIFCRNPEYKHNSCMWRAQIHRAPFKGSSWVSLNARSVMVVSSKSKRKQCYPSWVIQLPEQKPQR